MARSKPTAEVGLWSFISVSAGAIVAFLWVVMTYLSKDSPRELRYEPMPDDWQRTAILIVVVVAVASFLLQAWRHQSKVGAWQAEVVEAERKRQAELDRTKAAQEAARTNAQIELRHRTIARLEAIPSLLAGSYEDAVRRLGTAAEHLNSARGFLRSSTYSPFWEAVEDGVNELGKHQDAVQAIARLVSEQSKLAGEVDVEVPAGNSSMLALPESDTAEGAMHAFRGLVLEAQRDFHFASIFEQRRTTAAVVAGFENLSAAVSGLGARIEVGYSSLASALREQTAILERHHDDENRVATHAVVDEHISAFAMKHSYGGQILEINRNLERIADKI